MLSQKKIKLNTWALTSNTRTKLLWPADIFVFNEQEPTASRRIQRFLGIFSTPSRFICLCFCVGKHCFFYPVPVHRARCTIANSAHDWGCGYSGTNCRKLRCVVYCLWNCLLLYLRANAQSLHFCKVKSRIPCGKPSHARDLLVGAFSGSCDRLAGGFRLGVNIARSDLSLAGCFHRSCAICVGWFPLLLATPCNA